MTGDSELFRLVEQAKTFRAEQISKLESAIENKERERDALVRELEWWKNAIPIDVVAKDRQLKKANEQHAENEADRNRRKAENETYALARLKRDASERVAGWLAVVAIAASVVAPFLPRSFGGSGIVYAFWFTVAVAFLATITASND